MSNRIITMSRWSEEKREHFRIRTNFLMVTPFVIMYWRDEEGKDRAYQLTVESVENKTVTGHIDTAIQGDFVLDGTIGRIEIHDGDNVVVTEETEKPPKPKIELIDFEHGESFAVLRQYDIVPTEYSGYRGVWTFVDRLADAGSSGLRLFKTVARGWNLPGVLTPEIATNEKIQELIDRGYDEGADALNRCYLVGDEVVFLRSVPSGNSAIRAKAADVYTFVANSTILTGINDQRTLEQAAHGGMVPLRTDQSVNTIIRPIEVSHFQDDVDAIYEPYGISKKASVGTQFRSYVPAKLQDRAAGSAWSLAKRLQNTVEG